MTTNNHNYQPCEQAESLVSYLYDEIDATERARFQSHLSACAECTAELAGFGVVRSQVAEWRQEEFAPMAAPAIELPREVIITDENKISWLDSLRAFLAPQVAIPAAGFAALLIVAGVLFTSWNSGIANPDTVASNQSVPSLVNKQADEKLAPVNSIQSAPEQNIAENASKEDREDVKEVERTVTPAKRKARRESAPATARRNSESPLRNNSQQTAVRQPNKQPKIDLPEIDHDEDVDESLRLADLFGEFGEGDTE